MTGIIDTIRDALDREDIPYKSIVTGLALAHLAFESYVSYRQYSKLSAFLVKAKKEKKEVKDDGEKKTDDEVKKSGEASKDDLKKDEVKAANYSITRLKFSAIKMGFTTALTLFSIYYDLLPRAWNVGLSIASKMPQFMQPRSTLTESLYMSVVWSLYQSLVSLPFSLYSTFVIEEKYGFNKTTVGTFFGDLLKSQALSLTIGTPLWYCFLKIIDLFPTNFVAYVCAFVFVLQIIAVPFYLVVIAPLFNKFTPLEDGELKTEINKLASLVGFPLGDIFVIDGSKRSSHSNAYFTGLPLMKKRIVIYDTLIKQSTVPELIGVLGHEIGHWKLNHIVMLLSTSQVITSITFLLFSTVYKNEALYQAFGFLISGGSSNDPTIAVVSTYPILVGFTLYNLLCTPLDCGMQFLSNLLSRTLEFQADKFSEGLGYGDNLAAALLTLDKENSSPPATDPLYSAYKYGHPPTEERLNAIGFDKYGVKLATKKE